MMNLEQENQSLAELCSWVMMIPSTKDSRGSDCKRLLLKRLLNCCSWVTPNTEDSRGSDCKLPIAQKIVEFAAWRNATQKEKIKTKIP
jgi:hypothetical protein